MTDIILALHFLGLMMGAGGGFGSMIVMQTAARKSAEEAGVLRQLGPAMAGFSFIGLVLMLITGLALVWLKYEGFDEMPAMFWVKMIFVLTLTIAALATEFTYQAVKRGNVQAAARLPLFGPMAGLSSLLAVLFAALAFH